jgi:DNA-binding response OmpR family regulator
MPKILIVDDDPDVVDACTMILKREGYETNSALNRDDGMKLVLSYNPDLLILDVMMEQPDDGIAMAQELRRKNIKTPILMLTNIGKITRLSYGQDSDLVPVDAFEEKPLDPQTLIAVVKKLLEKKE